MVWNLCCICDNCKDGASAPSARFRSALGGAGAAKATPLRLRSYPVLPTHTTASARPPGASYPSEGQPSGWLSNRNRKDGASAPSARFRSALGGAGAAKATPLPLRPYGYAPTRFSRPTRRPAPGPRLPAVRKARPSDAGNLSRSLHPDPIPPKASLQAGSPGHGRARLMVIKKIASRSTTVAADLQVCSWDCSLGRAEALQLRSATQDGVKIIPLRP